MAQADCGLSRDCAFNFVKKRWLSRCFGHPAASFDFFFSYPILPSTLQYKVHLNGRNVKTNSGSWSGKVESRSGLAGATTVVLRRASEESPCGRCAGSSQCRPDAGDAREEGCRVKSEMPRRTNLGIAPNPNLLAGQISRSMRRAADASPCREPERAHWRAASCSALR